MFTLLPILARGEDDAIKIVIGVVVAIVWGIISLVSAINKKAQEQRRRQQYNQLPPQYPAQPDLVFAPPAPPPIPRQKGKRRKQRAAAPDVPQEELVEVAPMAVSAPIESPAARARAAQDAAPEASRVARLLKRPDTLRAAFILNEVLSPPVSMRDH